MQAIIPVAGIGSKLRPITYTQHKALIPLAGKPLLSHIIDQLKSMGVVKFTFVIGYLGEKIEFYVTENHKEIESRFVLQSVRYGTGHALWCALEGLTNSEPIEIGRAHV